MVPMFVFNAIKARVENGQPYAGLGILMAWCLGIPLAFWALLIVVEKVSKDII